VHIDGHITELLGGTHQASVFDMHIEHQGALSR
jgi:hypothetical protein